MIWALGNPTLMFDLVLLCPFPYAFWPVLFSVLLTSMVFLLSHFKVFFPSSGRTADPSKSCPLEANFKQLSWSQFNWFQECRGVMGRNWSIHTSPSFPTGIRQVVIWWVSKSRNQKWRKIDTDVSICCPTLCFPFQGMRNKWLLKSTSFRKDAWKITHNLIGWHQGHAGHHKEHQVFTYGFSGS